MFAIFLALALVVGVIRLRRRFSDETLRVLGLTELVVEALVAATPAS